MAEPESQPVAQPNLEVPGAPSDNTTLLLILDELRDEGYTTSFSAVGDEGEIRCDACGAVHPAAEFDDLAERRMEGASDPADELLVVAGTCPSCGVKGVLVLGFGPMASPADAAVVGELYRRRRGA